MFRLATVSDVPRIMTIIDGNRDFFKQQGIDQWQQGYPYPSDIEKDIVGRTGYVLLRDDAIVAYGSASFIPESHYRYLTEGLWETGDHNDFCTIHRLAVDTTCKGQGVASQWLREVETICAIQKSRSIRLDTHQDNQSMLRFLSKGGFVHCGHMVLPTGGERVAYEKVLYIDTTSTYPKKQPYF